MSPLACSLFALSALLATAHGLCTTKHVGDTSGTKIPYGPIYFQPPGADIDPVNNCPYPLQVVGEDITACNHDPNGPPPSIDGPMPPSFSSFRVRCSYYECPNGGFVNVIQYCG